MARVTLRIPDSLHDELREEASRQGVSLNTVLVAAVARWMASARASSWLKAERNEAAVRSARTILAQKARAAEASSETTTEEEAGEWAAELVRGHRKKKK